jgi:hypothetical protein
MPSPYSRPIRWVPALTSRVWTAGGSFPITGGKCASRNRRSPGRWWRPIIRLPRIFISHLAVEHTRAPISGFVDNARKMRPTSEQITSPDGALVVPECLDFRHEYERPLTTCQAAQVSAGQARFSSLQGSTRSIGLCVNRHGLLVQLALLGVAPGPP